MKKVIIGQVLVWTVAIVIGIVALELTGCSTLPPCKKYETITVIEYTRVHEFVEIPRYITKTICVEWI